MSGITTVSPLDTVLRQPDVAATIIGPVHLAAAKVQSGCHRSSLPSDESSQPGAVQVGPPDEPSILIDPVHLAAGKIQSRPDRAIQSRDELRPAGAVELGPPNFPRKTIAPVQLSLAIQPLFVVRQTIGNMFAAAIAVTRAKKSYSSRA